jgi:tetratricopeptide (TPR) repeat protein
MEQVAEALTRMSWGRQLLCACLAVLFWTGSALAGPFDEMSLERWSKLREVERYQLNIAEKYYKDQQWKVAADEYEKFLKLYEKSEGAPYAQLKWSHCQVTLRKQNTAIKDGYQSLIDYYPESPEAVLAAYLIGKTYKETGDIKAAKKAYDKVLSAHPKHVVAVYTRLDLVEIAAKENDADRRLTLLKELTYDVERKGDAAPPCVQASHQLAQHHFAAGNFGEGVRALETSYKDDALAPHLMNGGIGALPHFVQQLTGSADEATKKKGQKMADEAIAYLRAQVKNDIGDEKRKPRAVQCWYWIAEVQQYAHRPDKQKEEYETMLKTLGTDDRLLANIAQWYKNNNQRDQARATYLKFQSPIDGQRQIAQSWREEAKWDTALDIYRQLLTTDAKNAETYAWEIAVTTYQAGRWNEALTAFRGTERFPQNYEYMAMCNRQLKKYDEAILLYQQIIAGSAARASWAQLQIGYTHEQAERKDAAIQAFKTVCDRYPKTTEGSTAHEHLNSKYKISVTLGGAKD